MNHNKSSFRKYYNFWCNSKLIQSLDLTKISSSISSSNNTDVILGKSIKLVFFDEYASIEPVVWENLIEPR